MSNQRLATLVAGVLAVLVLPATAAAQIIIAPCRGAAGTRHASGGGFVAATASVAATSYLGPDAEVCNTAQVVGASRVDGAARIWGTAVVRDSTIQGAKISGAAVVTSSTVRGYAIVTDSAQVKNGALVEGGALVKEHAVIDHAVVRDLAWVSGSAIVDKDSVVSDHARVSGSAVVTCYLPGFATCTEPKSLVTGQAVVSGGARIRSSTVRDRVEVGGDATIRRSTLSGDVRITGPWPNRKRDTCSWYTAEALKNLPSIDGAVLEGNVWIDGDVAIYSRTHLHGDVVVLGPASLGDPSATVHPWPSSADSNKTHIGGHTVIGGGVEGACPVIRGPVVIAAAGILQAALVEGHAGYYQDSPELGVSDCRPSNCTPLRIEGDAVVMGEAWVHGVATTGNGAANPHLGEAALVDGDAEITCTAFVHGDAHVSTGVVGCGADRD